MSELARIDTIQNEIGTIDKAQASCDNSKRELREFILSDAFLEEPNKFHKLLSEWSDGLTTLVEATGTIFPGEGNLAKNVVPDGGSLGAGMLSKVEGPDLTVVKGGVLIVAALASVLVTYLFHGSYIIPLLVIAAIIFLCFFQPIIGWIQSWLKKPVEERKGLSTLTRTIGESISYMRNQYTQRRFLIKFQSSDPVMLAYHNPKDDPALFDRKTQTKETLPGEFLSRIDDISVECHSVVFSRKMELYAYLRSGPTSKQPQPVGAPSL